MWVKSGKERGQMSRVEGVSYACIVAYDGSKQEIMGDINLE